MTDVNLSQNEIGDEGAKAIGEALKVNTSLKKLYLHANDAIDDKGFVALVDGLKSNASLRYIELSDIFLSDKNAKLLASLYEHKDERNFEIGVEGGDDYLFSDRFYYWIKYYKKKFYANQHEGSSETTPGK